MQIHTILGIASVLLGSIGYVPYFLGIYNKRVKPHAFSWLAWGVLQWIVFSVDLVKNAGAGAWFVGISGTLNLSIFAIAVFKGEKDITLLDKFSLVAALACIGLWAVTTTPLYSVIIATLADFFGFIPTFRKSFSKPHEEALSEYSMSAIGFFISILALQTVSIVTVLYPASIVLSNSAFVAMASIRRRKLDGRRRK